MDEIAGACVSHELAAFAPADFAGAGKNECNGILAAMMVNPDPRARLHSKQSTPDRRADTTSGAIAARRPDPGVCAVPTSNRSGLTTWIVLILLMLNRSLSAVAVQYLSGHRRRCD